MQYYWVNKAVSSSSTALIMNIDDIVMALDNCICVEQKACTKLVGICGFVEELVDVLNISAAQI